uniref:Actin n=1 Tax=Rhabditophanes sp. KR3021 TaxID=114890 RepID=A0AC35TZ93_9BILA
MALYGGDDVSALVFDAGSHSFRAGYAGEEIPSIDIPSFIGVRNNDEHSINGLKTTRETFIGGSEVYTPRKETEIRTYMKDGLIEDWDLFEKVLDHVYDRSLGIESRYHGVLMSEAPWVSKEKREKLTELMFEKYNVPAFFTIKSPVLAAFSNGKSTGLVVDSGASQTYAAPVYDGYCLTQAVVRSNIGGDTIVDQFEKHFEKEGIEIVAPYKIATKQETSTGEKAKWVEKKFDYQVTESFEKFMKKQVIEDVAASALHLIDNIENENLEALTSYEYGFSTGLNHEFKSERYKIAESLFNLKYLQAEDSIKETLLDIPSVVVTSCSMADIDMRHQLYSNVMVTGGNSLIEGFSERLNHGLAVKNSQTIKIRVQGQTTVLERKFGTWIGGSISASLGSFQQLWISKMEYDESGKNIVEKKCA